MTHDKTHPRIDVMAKWLWMIYAILTIAETVLLMIGGMSFFDAVCHSFSTCLLYTSYKETNFHNVYCFFECVNFPP